LLGKVEADARLTRYLLGAVSETERENIEAEYLVDECMFEQMLIAEDELVDAYARGELSDQERTQFEKNFLTSARGRERVHFSQALAGAISDARPVPVIVKPSPAPSFFAALWASLTPKVRVAGVTFAVLLVAAFSWLLVERMRMRTELQELRAEHVRLTEQSKELQRIADAERARSAELAVQIEGKESQRGPEPGTPEQAPRRPPEDIIAFNISPGSVRGSGGGTRLAVPRSAKFIRLTLNFERPSSHQEYRAAIETPDGNSVWRNDSVGFRQNVTALDRVSLPSIPVSALPPGNYILLLSGKQADGNFEPVANYSFTITRK
jgi:hypothetical protein